MTRLLGLFGGYLSAEFSFDWSHEDMTRQSPVDLTSDAARGHNPKAFSLQVTKQIVNNGHSAVIKVAACQSPVDLLTSEAASDHSMKAFPSQDVPTQVVNNGHSAVIEASGHQSPVDLRTSDAVRDHNLKAFTFHDVTHIVNDGHSVRVKYNRPVVSGGALDCEHEVVEYHFHWGGDNSRGSEHTVDGRSYPMEMHMVTFNKRYGDYAKAATADGLAVLGVFFEISPNDNDNLEPLVSTLGNVTSIGEECAMPPLPVSNLLPGDRTRDQYYSYLGSLTTEPYRENVLWVVFKQPVPISTRQMEAFRALQSGKVDANGTRKPLSDNNREVQPLGDRTIRKSF